MLPFRRILFPVDYSDACRLIAPSVASMAAHFDSQITLLHACPWPMTYNGEAGLATYVIPDNLETDEKARLARFAAETFPGVEVRQVVEIDDPTIAIRREVQRQGTDLIMMPTRGHGVVRRVLLGSVSAKVLHDLSCPVWTGVHDALTAHPTGGYRSIICALNLGEECPAVARAAAAMAKAFGARLTLLHVVDSRVPSDLDYGPYLAPLMDDAKAKLELLQREHAPNAGVAVLHGDLTDTVGKCVEDNGADLVVVGRGHDQDPVGRVWSRLYAIVRESPCPVLSI